jgi:L-ribulose-5-phosphate 4-epimerase
MSDDLRRLKEDLVAYAKQLAALTLAPNTQGNLSVRDTASGLIVITPHDLPYQTMTVDDLVVVDSWGTVVDGTRAPSHETPVHCTVYRERPEVQAVIHSEPIYVNVFGVLGRPIEPVVTTLLLAFDGAVPVMPFMPSGSVAFGTRMLEVMGNCPAVIWGQHGCLTVGKDLDEALRRTVVLEGGAKIAYLALQLGTPAVLAPGDYPSLKA